MLLCSLSNRKPLQSSASCKCVPYVNILSKFHGKQHGQLNLVQYAAVVVNFL